MTTTYRGHEIVEVGWMESSGLGLAEAHRFIVTDHANGRCEGQVSNQWMTERGAQREINGCLPPEPPHSDEVLTEQLTNAMAAGLALWHGPALEMAPFTAGAL